MQYYDGTNFRHYNIPRSLKNVSVLCQTTMPQSAFSNCDFVENVAIVTGAEMNEKAFYGCSSLKKIMLPADMIEIGYQAFAECESLETINIPTRVKTIGPNAFYNARNLKNITMPKSITNIADIIFNGTDLFDADVSLFASKLTITCTENSEAYKYAMEHHIPVNKVSEEQLNIS